MEPFVPGQAYGLNYDIFIWVCHNAQPRSFDQCNLEDSVSVWQQLNQTVQARGLSRRVFVFRSGCLLGCKPRGTTVSIARKTPKPGEAPVQFYQNVTASDVDQLLADIL